MGFVKNIKSNKHLRKFLFHVLSGHTSSRRFRNNPYKLYFNASVNFNLFFNKYAVIEPEISKNIIKFINEESTIFDIGANIGYYSLLMSHLVNRGRIIAVEPDSNNVNFLKLNVRKNGIENIEIVEFAINNSPGRVVLYSDKSTGRTSSLDSGAWHPNSSVIKEETVNAITLDSLSEQYGFPDLIKCDVEGAELDVLFSGPKTLKHKPVLFIEVNKNRNKVYDLLKSNGYRIFNAEFPYDHLSFQLNEINVPNIICI